MPATIDVLMATYNGSRFLGEQIESVLQQVRPGLRLLIRDDGSSDGTLSLTAGYAARRPEVVLIEDGRAGLGACGSFAALLEHADADYLMLCDQDDVWLPGRVDEMLARMQELERQFGSETPLLVHTDLTVVDENLHTLHSSFWRYERLDPAQGGVLNRLLVQNVVTGCAAMLNRALAQRAIPIPRAAVMHDWWIALVAAAFGRLEAIPKSTILYRQHCGNRIGAKRWGTRHILNRALSLFSGNGLSESLQDTQRQAGAFLARFDSSLRPRHRDAVEAYAGLADQGRLERRIRLVRHGIYKSGWLRNLGLFAAI